MGEDHTPHDEEAVGVPADKDTTISFILLGWNCAKVKSMMLKRIGYTVCLPLGDFITMMFALNGSFGKFSALLIGERFHKKFSQFLISSAILFLLCILRDLRESKNSMLIKSREVNFIEIQQFGE
jgi:hypothetical protein